MSHTLRRPQKGYTQSDTQKRVKTIKDATGIDYSQVLIEKPENLQGVIEQHIGFHTIPIAIAAPLLIDGTYAKGYFQLPVCTVEGALVYSLTRGMMATADSGGIIVRHRGQKISRAPLFKFPSIAQIQTFIDFIDSRYEEIKKIVENTTRYGKLIEINKFIMGSIVVLEFTFTTANAAGQNMITLATQEACHYISTNYTGIEEYFIESGFNCDKKVSRKLMTSSRGHAVQSEVTLKKSVYSRLLHIDRKKIIEFSTMGAFISQITGTIGIQLNIANALAAIYMAMGQDVGCVAENSLGNIEFYEGEGDDLKISQTLPSLTIGTVGGGVHLPSQHRNLQIIGCHEGEHSSKKLAEIIGAAVLCLEISLASSIVSNTLSSAHKQFGRKNSGKH